MIQKKAKPAVHERKPITTGGAVAEVEKIASKLARLVRELEFIDRGLTPEEIAQALSDAEKTLSLLDDRLAVLACRAERSFGLPGVAGLIEKRRRG